MNFITYKLEYGGNVYLSATEGLAYKSGDYLAFTDFTKKGLTLSLTASGDWAHDHSYSEGREDFTFSDRSTLTRNFSSESSLRKTNNQAVRLKLTSTGNSHRLNAYVSLTRQAVPNAKAAMKALYTGHYDGTSQRLTSSDSRGLAPTAYANYTLWLPKDQTLDFTTSASFGHNRYNSHYTETAQSAMTSDVTVYFTDSYSSWQKGAIENMNKLVRQYIPKSANFARFSDNTIFNIQKKINRRPREKLNFSSPVVEFFKFFN